MKLVLCILPMLIGIGLAEPPVYERNSDYSKPRGEETFLYAVFSLDFDQRPPKTQIAVSSFGFVYVMERIDRDRYRFTPFLIPPHELSSLNKALHDSIPIIEDSRPKNRNEREVMRTIIGYSQPSLSGHSITCYGDAAKRIEPLVVLLRNWSKKAMDYWEEDIQPGKGEKTISTLETKDPEFLQHMMNTLHNVHTWKTKTKREQDGADQPATALESNPEGNSKPQPQSEERSQ